MKKYSRITPWTFLFGAILLAGIGCDSISLITSDQRGNSRPSGALGDIGAIER